MGKKTVAIVLSLLLAFLFSADPWTSLGTGTVGANSAVVEKASAQTDPAGGGTKTAATVVQKDTSKKLALNNVLTNGNFENGSTGFSSSYYSVVSGTDGNSYGNVKFDMNYRVFTSQQTSMKANVNYTFSFDYYMPSDYANMFAYGLSTVAGHPGAGQQIVPNGTAPYTITNLDTNATVSSYAANAQLLYYGVGTRTLAVDGVDRSDNNGTGGWRRFTMTFKLSSDAPSVYFFFMSYESGKKADGTTPLAYVANKYVAFDNVILTAQLNNGNHLKNGNFNSGSAGFTSSSTSSPYTIVTAADGNLYGSVTYDSAYRCFVSDKSSLKANTSYTFNFDYYIPSDNGNQFAYGLSTVAGHPGSGQYVTPSGTAPFTITNLDTSAVVQSGPTNTTLIHYGNGTRTLAVDGVNRSDGGETGGWRRFSITFTPSTDYSSVYFYFMSYEQGKKADNVTPLTYLVNKSVNYDNITIKGSYTVSSAANAGGKANMLILDPAATAGKVYDGGRVLYTAKPSYLSAFAGWTDGSGATVSTDREYLATPTDPTTLTANFTALNGMKTYGGEFGIDDETFDASSNATEVAAPNTTDIASLGAAHVKGTATTANQCVRYASATVAANTAYVLSLYLYGTGTPTFGVYSNTSGTALVSGTNVAAVNKYSVTSSGETLAGSNPNLSSTTFTPIAGDVNQWFHYTIDFNTAGYSGAAYFALTIPNTTTYYLIDNVSLTKSCSITLTPATGGTISSSQYGGTVSSSTAKTFYCGSYVTVKAAPDTNKSFVAWMDAYNNILSYNKTYSFPVNGTLTVKPMFDTGNLVSNPDFAGGMTGWSTYGDATSGVAASVLGAEALEAENVPATPLGNSALKLSYNRTDGLMNKRVQAYGTLTFATENNTTYEVSAWVYSKYLNTKLSLFVPTAQFPYQIDATNDFTYVGSGYNIGATQLAGTYKYYLNDVLKAQTGMYSMYTNPNRTFDLSGNKNGWTKISMIFTTDGNANCVKNCAVSLGTQSYSSGGINYTAGSAYFTDISVKKFSTCTIVNNNKAGGMVTANGQTVLSSTAFSSLYGKTFALTASAYKGYKFDGWFKDAEPTAFSTNLTPTLLYAGTATYTAKYSIDNTQPNLFLDDMEILPNGTDIEDTGSNSLGVWKLLSAANGSYTSWGAYNASNGVSYGVTPHSGTELLADYGRYNVSYRTLTVSPNTNYMFSFYYYQKTLASNTLSYAAITTATNANVKTGSSAERTAYSSDFLAYNYTAINANSTWRKYTLTFNSGSNSTLKFFMKYDSPGTDSTGYLFLDDFSLLPVNTVDSTGTTALSISNNTTALSTSFRGISSTVYHAMTYMDDAYGRNYTDEMATFEFDRLKNSGIKQVRTIFKSQWAWSDTLGTWDWNSTRMNDFYQWATEMQNRGIDIDLNAGWSLTYLITGSSSIPEVSYLYAGGDYNLACARYGQWITQALQACQSRGINNIKNLIVFTEPSPIYPNGLGAQAPQWVQACNALDTALRSAGIRGNYKIVGPNQGSTDIGTGLLDYALTNGDSAIDIYSTHYYPSSTSIMNDVYGGLTSNTYTNYMTVMANHGSTKDFWADEYFAKATDAALGADVAWSGTQTCVGMTSAMNAGIDSVISWQELDQLWVDQTNTGGEFVNGVHTCGTAPSLFVSPVPRSQFYALTLMSKYLGYQGGMTYTSTAPANSGLYISTAKMADGSWSVMVVNAGTTTQKFQATFATAINQTLYRHLFDPATVHPDASAKVIAADKVYNTVGTSFCDSIPSGGVAIYTGLDF